MSESIRPQLREYWAQKKMKMRCWRSSLQHRIYLNSLDYSILPFLNNDGKLFPLCIILIFVICFEWARRQPVVQTLVPLTASLVSKVSSVIWFLTVCCDWYNKSLVKNSRSPDVNLFWKICLYLIANYPFIYVCDKKIVVNSLNPS